MTKGALRDNAGLGPPTALLSSPLSVCTFLFQTPVALSTAHLLPTFLFFDPFLFVLLSRSPFLGAASTPRGLRQELEEGESAEGAAGRSWGGVGGGEAKPGPTRALRLQHHFATPAASTCCGAGGGPRAGRGGAVPRGRRPEP